MKKCAFRSVSGVPLGQLFFGTVEPFTLDSKRWDSGQIPTFGASLTSATLNVREPQRLL